MPDYITTETCKDKHRTNWILWGGAVGVLGLILTVMLAAVSFAWSAKTDAWEVKRSCDSHEAQAVEHRRWVEKTLNEIKTDVRVLRNGHGHIAEGG